MNLDYLLRKYEKVFTEIGLPQTLHIEALEKLYKETFDIGEYVQFNELEDLYELEEYCDNCSPSCIEKMVSNIPLKYSIVVSRNIVSKEHVFLIDHMWTTTFPQSLTQLKALPSLCRRIGAMFDINFEGIELSEEEVNMIWNKMWSYMIGYNLSGETDGYTQWCLMDEVGTSLRHSTHPNCVCAAIMFQRGPAEEPFAVSLLWPISDIICGEELTRDYLPSIPLSSLVRPLRLLGYLPQPLPSNVEMFCHLITGVAKHVLQSLPQEESIMSLNLLEGQDSAIELIWKSQLDHLADTSKSQQSVLKIFCDRQDHINSSFLRSGGRFQFVTNPSEAHILYLIDHTTEDKNLNGEYIKKGKVINQFWWNGMIVSKEHLAKTAYRAMKKINHDCTPFLAQSFDLGRVEELAQYIMQYASDLKSKDYKNIWILKRYRGRQSVDYPITDNLACALHHLDTAPRLACSYIKSPVLYDGRKFDLRYYVLVLSLKPLVLRRYPLFIVRCANKRYDLQNLQDYQTHFTLMSQLDDPVLGPIRGGGYRQDPTMLELINHFDIEYAGKVHNKNSLISNWKEGVEPLIDVAIRQVFESVELTYMEEPPHPSGQALHPNAGWSLNQPNICPARAMFGVDVMLKLDQLQKDKFELQPIVLEVQWAPDCSQALRFNEHFWDDILAVLFLNDESIAIPI